MTVDSLMDQVILNLKEVSFLNPVVILKKQHNEKANS